VIQVPTLVYSSRCVGCGDCVDICPSDIMHFDPKTRKAYNGGARHVLGVP
jgi:4Fe-4S binding domain.